MLVCDDCADRFPGFSSSNLTTGLLALWYQTVRPKRPKHLKRAPALPTAEREEKAKRTALRVSVPDEEMVFYDAVLTRTKGIAEALVDGGVFPVYIFSPFLQILTHWVRRRHALVTVRRKSAA